MYYLKETAYPLKFNKQSFFFETNLINYRNKMIFNDKILKVSCNLNVLLWYVEKQSKKGFPNGSLTTN